MAKHIGRNARRGLPIRILLGLALGLILGVFATLPSGPAAGLVPVASAHALLVRSEPAADAILKAPPPQVRMWFSEDLNAQTSRAVVVDPSNRQRDMGDSHVNSDNSRELDVSLPLLPAGTYIVVWRTQSAEDGHIVGGSFIFRIARPDGSVPPLPSVPPTGHFPGAAGTGATPTNSLDGPTLAQTASTWLALLFMTFWVGGLIWQTWILPANGRNGSRDLDVQEGARGASARFRQLAPYALIALIWVNVGIVLAQAAELAGGWSGVTSAPLLRAVLFGSRFGTFWWMREIVALAALLVAAFAARESGVSGAGRGEPRPDDEVGERRPYSESAAASARPAGAAIPAWRREVVDTLLRVRGLPRRLVVGVREQSWLGRAELALGAALLVAFALSGHAAAVQSSELAYAVSVDLLHLVCEAAWVGGLFYIGVVFVPALVKLEARQRARVLALGLPEFGAVAIVSAVVLAATGSLNTTIHLTSASQFLTTAYGQTLAVKIEFFLIMVAISSYHAFVLRPRLAAALAEAPAAERAESVGLPAREALVGAGGTGGTGGAEAHDRSAGAGRLNRDAGGMSDEARREDEPPESGLVSRLADRLEDWLRREAMIGGVVLLCVALLAAFAGTLAPAASAGATGAAGGTGVGTPAVSHAFTQTQSAGEYSVTLNVTPATFGMNTFTVSVRDAQGKSVDGASVLTETQSLDMDMGTQRGQLQPAGASAPGVYSGQGQLDMAGHWLVTVKVLPPGSKQFVQASFKFIATY